MTPGATERLRRSLSVPAPFITVLPRDVRLLLDVVEATKAMRDAANAPRYTTEVSKAEHEAVKALDRALAALKEESDPLEGALVIEPRVPAAGRLNVWVGWRVPGHQPLGSHVFKWHGFSWHAVADRLHQEDP